METYFIVYGFRQSVFGIADERLTKGRRTGLAASLARCICVNVGSKESAQTNMLKLTVFTSAQQFAQEFERCCKAYTALNFAAAWLGDPKHVLPYAHLKEFKGSIIATVGRSFNSTHPDGLELLRDLKVDLRIFRDDADLFHPKVYLFSAGSRIALFVGSSNLTYSGFYANVEANALLEGTPGRAEQTQIDALRRQLKQWRQDGHSFAPSPKWLRMYRKAFERTLHAQRKARIRTPVQQEDELPDASWLG